MRTNLALAALVAPVVALSLQTRKASEATFKLEFAPNDVRIVTESEKFALIAENVKFFDITDLKDEPVSRIQSLAEFPESVTKTAAVNALLPQLSASNLETTLTTFSEFHNRYFNGSNGVESASWLLEQVQSIIADSNVTDVTAEFFPNTFQQPSIIAKIPGQSEKTIVVGAHQDSINGRDPQEGRAPGADDDGSGTVTILEAFRVLLTDPDIASGSAENTIEFHWYAGEEGGLLGSLAIFEQYAQEGRDVKAMYNQDMTGYVKPDTEEVIAIITDNVDETLTAYIRKVIAAYSSLPTKDSECGYSCSDHASAARFGYPSAFTFESTFEDKSPYIHTADDTLDTVDFDHALEFAKVVVGFAYELGFASL